MSSYIFALPINFHETFHELDCWFSSIDFLAKESLPQTWPSTTILGRKNFPHYFFRSWTRQIYFHDLKHSHDYLCTRRCPSKREKSIKSWQNWSFWRPLVEEEFEIYSTKISQILSTAMCTPAVRPQLAHEYTVLQYFAIKEAHAYKMVDVALDNTMMLSQPGSILPLQDCSLLFLPENGTFQKL